MSTIPISQAESEPLVGQPQHSHAAASTEEEANILSTIGPHSSPNKYAHGSSRKRQAEDLDTETSHKPSKKVRPMRKQSGKDKKSMARHEKPASRDRQNKSDHHDAPDASLAIPIILPPLPHRVMEKIRVMRTFIRLIDSQAGLTYADIDAYGLGDPVHTCLPSKDFLAALKILAADLDLESPDAVDLSHGGDMITNIEQPMSPSGTPFHWTTIDFSKSNVIETKAQALIGNRGFQGRNLLGIECCMQAWHQTQLAAARTPVPGFRHVGSADHVSGITAAWTPDTWQDSQPQDTRVVSDLIATDQNGAKPHEDLYERNKIKIANKIFTIDPLPWLQNTRKGKVDLLGEDQISPRTINTYNTDPGIQLKAAVSPPPPADIV